MMRIRSTDPLEAVLQEQLAYYRARADEYDQWFFRTGRYDCGPDLNAQWFSEIEEVRAALAAFRPSGRVLELACGTGLWTEQLVQHAEHLTAVDASPEMLALNRARLGSAPIHYVQADVFTWQPNTRYDVVFFGFWLSHVPPERFVAFWEFVRLCAEPSGRFFFVDSLYNENSTARDHYLEGPATTTVTRRLNDGREFRIVKRFYGADQLESQLAALGWRATVRSTANYFLYGFGLPKLPPPHGHGTGRP